MILAVVAAAKWRRVIPLGLLLVTPLTFFFAQGMAEWFKPSPMFYRMGLPGSESLNLDPESRCFPRTGGCVVVGGEWVSLDTHNSGLKLMVTLFGKPPRVYAGPYPAKAEALELMAPVPETPLTMFTNQQVMLAGKPFALNKDVIEGISWELDRYGLGFEDEQVEWSVQALLHQDNCLMVRFRAKRLGVKRAETASSDSETDACYLFDKQTLRAFARYTFKGDDSWVPRLRIQ
jgi:hypothetical protein